MANSFVIGQYRGLSHLGMSNELDEDEIPGDEGQSFSSGRFGNDDQPHSQRPQPVEAVKGGPHSHDFAATSGGFEARQARGTEMRRTDVERRPTGERFRFDGRGSVNTPTRNGGTPSEGIEIVADTPDNGSFVLGDRS